MFLQVKGARGAILDSSPLSVLCENSFRYGVALNLEPVFFVMSKYFFLEACILVLGYKTYARKLVTFSYDPKIKVQINYIQ